MGVEKFRHRVEACFESNHFRHGNGNCAKICKNAQSWKLMKVLPFRLYADSGEGS
jgi:hypothetical protein